MIDVSPARIGPGQCIALQLERGQFLSIVDIFGGQVVDLMAVHLGDKTEWLSNGRSFDYVGKLYFSTGDTLFSNKSNAMLTIVSDDVGRHDFLFAACSSEMFRIQYGLSEPTRNCLDNLTSCLSREGVTKSEMQTPFNVFMNSEVRPDGTLALQKPLSACGNRIVFRAEMELSVALSACPAEQCNGDGERAAGYQITKKQQIPSL